MPKPKIKPIMIERRLPLQRLKQRVKAQTPMPNPKVKGKSDSPKKS